MAFYCGIYFTMFIPGVQWRQQVCHGPGHACLARVGVACGRLPRVDRRHGNQLRQQPHHLLLLCHHEGEQEEEEGGGGGGGGAKEESCNTQAGREGGGARAARQVAAGQCSICTAPWPFFLFLFLSFFLFSFFFFLFSFVLGLLSFFSFPFFSFFFIFLSCLKIVALALHEQLVSLSRRSPPRYYHYNHSSG